MVSISGAILGVDPQEAQRKRDLQDSQRKDEISKYMGISNNIHKHLALLMNPDTMQPLPGKEQEVAGLRQNLQQVDAYVKNLYNPSFDVNKGAVAESPIHRLGDILHVTKAPAQVQSQAPQIAQQFGDSTVVDQQLKQRGVEQNIESARALLKKYGADDKTIKDVTEGMLGVKPAAVKPVLKLYQLPDGTKQWYDASDPDQIPDGAVAVGSSGRAMKEKTIPDQDSETGFSTIGYGEDGKEQYRVKNVVPPRSAIPSETTSTDTLGVTTHSVRTPIFPGVKQGNPLVPGKRDKTTGAPLGATTKQAKPAGVQKKELQSKIGQPKQVDASGHIPETDRVNPGLKEAANNLLDGMAVKDLPIPQKDRGAAEALAKEYGWAGQGMFTPKDKLLIRESTAILHQVAKSPSLSVFDDDGDRLALTQVLQDPTHRNAIGQIIQERTSRGMDDATQQYLYLYNQAVGRISGLSQLVRSGRATEATINRLKSELPTPWNARDSAAARAILAQIQSEIDIAVQSGHFEDVNGQTGSSSMSDDEFLQNVK